MAEVVGILGLIGSIVSILEGLGKVTTLLKRNVHKSSTMRKELVPVLGKLTAFTGVLHGLQLECELDESDSARLQVYEHIRAPLEASEKAAKTIMARLNQAISVGGISLAFGKVLNKETITALHILYQAKDVFDLALDADQRTLLKAIEKYVRTVAEDLRDMLAQEQLHYKDLRDDLKNIRSNEEKSSKARSKVDLLLWVSQVNYSSNYNAAKLHIFEDDQSGNWFLKSRKFEDWSKATSRAGLLVTGISGAGKTVLCSKAIGHVLHSRSPNWGKSNIIYFFFDFNDIFKQNVESMVRSLIYQLLAKADEVPEAVQKFYAKHQSTASVVSSPRSEEWQDILVALLRDTDQTFVFIDALDECADSESPILGGTIQRLFKEGGAHAKWLLTARPSARPLSFREEFGFENLHMEEGAVNRDIELHLKVRLQNDPKLSTFAPKAKEMIISSIVSASGGMFRYAQCQLNALSKLKDRRVKTIREALDTMPKSLQSTYSQILYDLHNSDEWPILERTLTLVSFSARPVTVKEVAEFAILEDRMTTIESEERFENFDDILCLVTSLIDIQDGHLTLAHKSVQEFLSAGPDTYFPRTLKDSYLYEGGDYYIAKRCLQYLSFPERPACEVKEYKDVKSPNAVHLARLLSEYPFLDYAASRWAYHVRSEEVRNLVSEDMQKTIPLIADPNLWKAWLLLQRADIWETRVQLARLLCEVSIRCTTLPNWACNFWKARQAYRFTTATAKSSHLDKKPSQKYQQGGNFLSLRVLSEVRKTAESQIPCAQNVTQICLEIQWKSLYSLAAILLEVALQTNLYSDLNLIWSNISSAKALLKHLESMLALSKYVATIMGEQYSAVIDQCLSIFKQPIDSGKMHAKFILEVQDDAMEMFHAPLQSMLKSGFRASCGPVNVKHKNKVQADVSKPSASERVTAIGSYMYYHKPASAMGYESPGTYASGYARAESAKLYEYSAISTPYYVRPSSCGVVGGPQTMLSVPAPYSEVLMVLPGNRLVEPLPLPLQLKQPLPIPGLPAAFSQSVPPRYSYRVKQQTPAIVMSNVLDLRHDSYRYMGDLAIESNHRGNTRKSHSKPSQGHSVYVCSMEDLLHKWMRLIDSGAKNVTSEQRLTWQKEAIGGEPFELVADEMRHTVEPKAALNVHQCPLTKQKSKYDSDNNALIYDSLELSMQKISVLAKDANEKTMEELACELMRQLRRESHGGTVSWGGYISNEERNRRKNEGGPFELPSP